MVIQRSPSTCDSWPRSARSVNACPRGLAQSLTCPISATGMSQALTAAIYLLVCRETGEPGAFPGSAFIYNNFDDCTYAPSLADLSVWAATQDHCANEDFVHCNGDVYMFRYFWPQLGEYFGMKVCVCIFLSHSLDETPRPPRQAFQTVQMFDKDTQAKSQWWNGRKIKGKFGRQSVGSTAARLKHSTGVHGHSLIGRWVRPG